MKKLLPLFLGLLIVNSLIGQSLKKPTQTKIMTLGVFHFAFNNMDVVKTAKKDQISVLDEPYQSEIISICKALEEFQPTMIAVELAPQDQQEVDSLFHLYKSGKFELEKNEVYQLGFRIGKSLNIPQITCVNDWGRHYQNLYEIFKDSTRVANFEHYHNHSPDTIYHKSPKSSPKVTSIIKELKKSNDPQRIKERLGVYLLNPFKYEEKVGDFTGVDFESGRWFNRNLRIFRNVQRMTSSQEERILLIIGAEHLNLLNIFFEASKEFKLVSPLPYLEKSSKLYSSF